jgi:hypothetical protein
MHGAAQVSRLVDGVSVSEEEPAAARMTGRSQDGVGLSGRYWLRMVWLGPGCFEDGDTGEAAGDFGGAVAGVVVDYDQFPVFCELKD